MSGSDGKLTAEETDKFQAWINEKWHGSKICPVSGHNDWVLGDRLVAPPSIVHGKVALGGSVYPQIMMICRGCGYTIYFNAVLAGIVPAIPGGQNDAGK